MVWLIIDLLFHLTSLLSTRTDSWKRGIRFRFCSDSFESRRPGFCLFLLRSAALLVIARSFESDAPTFAVWSVYVFYGVLVVSGILIFVLSLSRMHVMQGVILLHRFTLALDVVSLAILSSAVFGYVSAMYPRIVGYNLGDFRLGVLLWGLSYLLPKALEEGFQRPLLSALQDLRKRLAFGKLDVGTAIRQTEIALEGMTFSDLLQGDITSLLVLDEQVRGELLQVQRCIEAVLADIKQLENGLTLSKEQQTALFATLESAERHLESATSVQGEYSRQFRRLMKRTRWIPLCDKDSKLSFRKMMMEIEEGVKETTRRSELVKKALEELRNKKVPGTEGQAVLR